MEKWEEEQETITAAIFQRAANEKGRDGHQQSHRAQVGLVNPLKKSTKKTATTAKTVDTFAGCRKKSYLTSGNQLYRYQYQ